MSQQGVLREDEDEAAGYETVGTAEHRVDAVEKVTGRAAYTGDLDFDDLAHARIIRSTVAHGTIEELDTEAAASMDGVLAVVTADDVPGDPTIGLITKDHPILSDGTVRYLGDAIAIVVAEDEATARSAADAVKIDYERRDAALSAEEALAPDATPIHPGGNVIDEYEYRRGDPEAAMESADAVVRETYSSSMIDHVPIEPEATVAHYGEDGDVEVWTSTQHPQGDRENVAQVLGIGQHQVTVNRPEVGGAFGSKLEHHQPCYAALASAATGVPVRVRYSRDEEFKGTVKRNVLELEYAAAADADGTLRVISADITVDGGAYASFSSAVAVRSLVHCTGPYAVETLEASGRAVYTNKPWGGAMRSFDMFQTTFAVESLLDQLAEELGIDPIELRRKNALDGATPASTTGQEIDAVALPETIDVVADRLDDLADTAPEDPYVVRGTGVACMWYGCGKTGHNHPSSAFCEIHADATATIQCAVSEIGQGSQTALTQIAAETLGIDVEDVRFVSDSTDAPEAGKTSASRQTYVSGEAIRRAAVDALGPIRDRAANKLRDEHGVSVAPDELTIAAGTIRPANDSTGPSLELADLVAESIHDGVLLTGSATVRPVFDFDLDTFEGAPYPTYSFATHGVVLDVDTGTGEVTVQDIVAAHDVGQAINPALVEGQIEGGAVMGLGHTLMEEVEFDGQGQLLNASLMDYHIPTTHHAPAIETELIQTAKEDVGPFGAKGVGESALIPIGAAIANALADATGARVTDLPLSPDSIVAELE